MPIIGHTCSLKCAQRRVHLSRPADFHQQTDSEDAMELNCTELQPSIRVTQRSVEELIRKAEER